MDPLPGRLSVRHHYARASDFGDILNSSSPAEPFTHDLDGVDQKANWIFVNILLGSFLALMIIILGYRLFHRSYAYLRLLFTIGRDRVSQSYWKHNNTFWGPVIKRYLIYAPLGRVRHNREIQLSSAVTVGTLPSRSHALILGSYLTCNIAYCLVLHWGRKNPAEVVAELRGRTGIMATVNLLLTVLFALRNNPLIGILGISYESFNLLHRWCARMTIFESLVHTLCWSANAVRAGGLHNMHAMLSTSLSYQGGMIGTVVMLVMGLTTVGPLRHAFYETFLNGHKLLAFLALCGVYIHIDKARLPQLPYVQLCFLFWMTEYFWRLGSILYFNVSRRRGFTTITVEALPSEACRVTFDLARPWRYRPGCYVHAYIPSLAWHSSHPFSVAWGKDLLLRETELADLSKRLSMDLEKQTQTHARSSPSTPTEFPTYVTSISLIVRARTGMTRALYNRARNCHLGSFTTHGALEGPYGGHENLASYGTVILFAGGVGVTHCVGYLKYLLERYHDGTCSTQRVLFVWSVPNSEALDWVRPWMDEVLKMPGRRDLLRIKIFVTKPRNRDEHSSSSQSLRLFPGRCNPSAILQQEMPERVGAMGVTVCGPGAFADSVRAAVRDVMMDGMVDFVEEAFTY